MLFYTTVFNAIQSVLVRVLSTRRTDKSWIQTEDIDIGHYVAIRKEFERVNNELRRARGEESHHPIDNANGLREVSHSARSIRKSFEDVVKDIVIKLRYPRLSRRRRQLLVPIRFHELRAHFIDSNDLPQKFKVSHYLKRSLTGVLLDFVHVSTTAWIMLMATGNLVYFLSGIILSSSKSNMTVSEFLSVIFFVLTTLFVVIALVLYFKMRSIFSQILQ